MWAEQPHPSFIIRHDLLEACVVVLGLGVLGWEVG